VPPWHLASDAAALMTGSSNNGLCQAVYGIAVVVCCSGRLYADYWVVGLCAPSSQQSPASMAYCMSEHAMHSMARSQDSTVTEPWRQIVYIVVAGALLTCLHAMVGRWVIHTVIIMTEQARYTLPHANHLSRLLAGSESHMIGSITVVQVESTVACVVQELSPDTGSLCL